MKGLILKDFYRIRFQMILAFAVMLFPNMLFGPVFAEMFGSFDVNDTRLGAVLVSILINYISIILCSLFISNNTDDNIKSGWSKIQLTMPLSAGEIIGGGLISSGLALALTAVFIIFCNLVCIILFGLPIEPMITGPVILALLQMIPLSVSVVSGYSLGSLKSASMYTAITIITAFGLGGIVARIARGSITLTAARLIGYAGVPMLSAAVIVLCFSVGKKAVTKEV